MKKFLIFFLLATFSFSSFSQSKSSSDVYVKSYTRSNGTVVKGYYRTAPNSTNRDNFSTRGNVNPYTGQAGYVKPDNKANTSTYSYSSSSNSSQINNSKTATFKNGKWIIPSASEKNTFQDGTLFYVGDEGISNKPRISRNGYIELKKLPIIEFNGSANGNMLFYKRGDEYRDYNGDEIMDIIDGLTYDFTNEVWCSCEDRYVKFGGVLKIEAKDMIMEDDKHIFINDGPLVTTYRDKKLSQYRDLKTHELDIILEREIILTLKYSLRGSHDKIYYYILSPAQIKVLSMFDVKEILFRTNREYISKNSGELNEKGKVFNYVSKITTENTKQLLIN
tara:strand:+ start:161 stop:1165 length:1005 start_codon:yes stop_codon:yes gene_type:complete